MSKADKVIRDGKVAVILVDDSELWDEFKTNGEWTLPFELRTKPELVKLLLEPDNDEIAYTKRPESLRKFHKRLIELGERPSNISGDYWVEWVPLGTPFMIVGTQFEEWAVYHPEIHTFNE